MSTKFNLQQTLNNRGFIISSPSKTEGEALNLESDLKLLEGVGGLSEDDYNSWKNEQISLGKLKETTLIDRQDRLYRNQQYIKRYGIDDFKLYSASERDARYKSDVLSEIMLKHYGSDPRFNEIRELSEDKQIELLKSGYVNTNTLDYKKQQRYYDASLHYNEKSQRVSSEIFELENALKESNGRINDYALDENSSDVQLLAEEQFNESLKKRIQAKKDELNRSVLDGASATSQAYKDTYSKPITFSAALSNIGTTNQMKGIYGTRQEAVDAKQHELKVKYDKNQDKLNKTIQEDNDSFLEDNTDNLIKLETSIVDSYNSKEQSYDDIAETFENVMQYSNHYKAFKDAEELRYLGLTDKIKFIAAFETAKQQYGEIKAISVVDQMMRNYISEEQDWWDWTKGTAKNIWVGGVAHMANEGLAIQSLIKAAQSLTGGSELTLFLQGYDSNGNPLANWRNPQYWNGVDQFNTFDAAEINRARENGGVSQFNNITIAGTEYDFWSWNTANEAAKMSKYIWSTALTSYLGGTLLKGVSAGAKLAGMSAKSIDVINSVGNFANRMAAAAPMSLSMGVNSFNETKQTLDEAINKQVDKEIQEKIKNTPKEVVNALVERYLNSLEVNTQIEEYINKYKQASSEGKALNISEDYLRNQYKEGMRKELLKNPEAIVNMFLGEDIKNEVEANHSQARQDAIDAATKAFMVQATITQVKETFELNTFKDWMLAPSARGRIVNDFADRIVSDAGGNLSKVSLTAFQKALPFGKQILGNGGDEWFDGLSEGAAQGFGLGYFNNITGGRYNPESYIYAQNFLGNMLSGIDEGWKGVREKATDEGTIYEALIGAVSVFGVNPNIGGALEMITNKPSDWSDRSIIEKIDQFVSNPLLHEAAELRRQERELDNTINTANEIIRKNKEGLLDISTLVTSNNRLEESVVNHNVLESQDAQARQIFDFAYILKRDLADDILGQSKALQDIQAKINAYANGEIDDDIINQFLAKPHNQALNQQPNARELAKQRIQQQASKAVKIQEEIASVEQSLLKSEAGRNMSETTKKQLIFNKIFDTDVSERLNAIENNVNGRSNISEETNSAAEYSTQSGYDTTVKNLTEEIDANKKSLEDAKKRLKKLNKKVNLSSEEQRELAISKFIVRTLEEDINTASLRLKELKNNPFNEETHRVLNKDEILALNPTQRAKMLDRKNRELYSEEQRLIINELIKDLNRKDPDLLSQIQDAGILYRRRNSNREAYDKILNNQSVFDNYAEYMEESFQERAQGVVNSMVKERIFRLLDSNLDQDLKRVIAENGIGPKVLAAYAEQTTEERKNILQPIIELGNLHAVARDIIDRSNPNKLETIAIKNLVYQITKNADNVEHAMLLLEQRIDSVEDPNLKQQLESLLRSLANANYQRNAQVIEDRTKREEESKKSVEENKQKELESKEQKPQLVENTLDNSVQTGEGVEVNLESPTIAEQAKFTDVAIQTVEKDINNEGNDINSDSLESYVGNIFPGFETQPLIEDGTLVPKKGANEKDRMNVLYDFLANKGIKLQDIIDFELSKVVAKNLNVKVHFMMYKQNDNDFNNFIFNVIEYTEDVRKIHNESRGGVITANGKQYLIIGVTGTNFNISSKHKQLFFRLKDRLVPKKIQYFNNNQSELYWVSDEYTQIKEIQAGRRVRKSLNEETKIRSISELMYDEEGNYNEISNPKHVGNPKNKRLGYADLAWYIQKGDEYIPVNTGSKKVVPLNYPENNNGSVFLLVEGANGKLFPVYIQPTFYNELKQGALKDRINSLLMELTSKDFNRRKNAKEQLKQFLVLSDDNTFSIGKEGFNRISIKRNGSIYKTFDLDSDFNVSDFIQAVTESNFRINITVSILSDPSLLAEYDAAGALTTDVSVLGTRNASYTLYTIDDNGEPIITDAPSYVVKSKNSSSNTSIRHIQYGRKRYHLDGDTYKDELDNVITDKELIKKLNYASQISKMEPSLQARGYNYYILNDSKDNPIVIRVGQSDDITIANTNQALSIIEEVNKVEEAKAKAEAAKVEYEKAMQQAEDVDLEGVSDIQAQSVEIFEDTKSSVTETITPTSISPTQETKKDINEAGNISLENLDSSSNLTTFAQVFSNTKFRSQLKKIFKAKGWNWGTQSDIEALLKSKDVSLTNITNIDSWLDLIKNCR